MPDTGPQYNIGKRFFDERGIPDDLWLVLEASSLLGIPEFQLFEIAYREWFGEEGDEKKVEKFFIPYMFNKVVPPWVRHFSNRVVDLDASGELHARDFGIEPEFATRESLRKGLDFAAWLVLSLTGLIILGQLTAKWMNVHCILPPCY